MRIIYFHPIVKITGFPMSSNRFGVDFPGNLFLAKNQLFKKNSQFHRKLIFIKIKDSSLFPSDPHLVSKMHQHIYGKYTFIILFRAGRKISKTIHFYMKFQYFGENMRIKKIRRLRKYKFTEICIFRPGLRTLAKTMIHICIL